MPQVGIIATYTDLINAIADNLDRNDLTTVIGLWPQLLESKVNSTLRHHKMIAKSTASGLANDGRIALPSDWLETRNLEINGIQMLFTSPDMLDVNREYIEPTEDTQGLFAYSGSDIEIWPVPTVDYSLALDYYQKIPALANQESATNWLLKDAPDLYLYGCLIYSAPYLRDDERIGVWRSFADEALMFLETSSNNAMHRGSRIQRNKVPGNRMFG